MYTIRQTEKYVLKKSDAFDASFTSEQLADGIELVTLHAHCKEGADKLELVFSWVHDDVDIQLMWSPVSYHNKLIRPDWGGYIDSTAMCGAPVLSNLTYDDKNRLTIACSDAKNRVGIKSGVIEESAELSCLVRINVDCAVSDYTAQIRIDTRDIPFYQAIGDVTKWWESFDGYAPAYVPELAKMPLYSAWYSFHQNIDIPHIIEECRYFKALGCETIIIDDGWQCDNNRRGYGWCGDWEPTPSKIPDMKAFVDAVHETGMKFMLWYSVPFVGIHSKLYEKWKDKVLRTAGLEACVLDPRYPEVREYLINTYKNAMLDWGLDGFKLDFIDSFSQSGTVKDGMDYVSVYDAVERLMKDVMITLRELNPEILIEFRQSYIGPLMRTFGNMLRSADCPNDSYSNRMNTLSLRLVSGSTAVHSDMVMWSYNEPCEIAAFQLTHVLFAVPQISVLHDRMPADHTKMVGHYLKFWTDHRETLLDGELFCRGYAANFAYVSSRKGDEQVGAVYAGRIATISEPTDSIILINASKDKSVLVEGICGDWNYTVTDCKGDSVTSGIIRNGEADDFYKIDAPVNGYIYLKRA